MRPRHAIALTLATGALLAWQARTDSQAPAFDLVIRGGRVIDGTGNPWFVADLGIKGDSIVAVAPPRQGRGALSLLASSTCTPIRRLAKMDRT